MNALFGEEAKRFPPRADQALSNSKAVSDSGDVPLAVEP